MIRYSGYLPCLLLCAGYVIISLDIVVCEVKSASACHDSRTSECNTMSLECPTGFTIRLLNMKYGVKDGNCGNRRNQCFKTSRDGCCVFQDGDCTEYYTPLHAFVLHELCSGKQACNDLVAPDAVLSSCGDRISTYVHVLYECVPESSFGDFCGSAKAGNDINLIFSSETTSVKERSNCTCSIRSPTSVIIEYVDVRMFKSNNMNFASLCSSASLVTEPSSTVDTTCFESLNEQDNFIYDKSWTGPSITTINLEHLAKLGAVDVPEFIWLNLIGTEQVGISVTCYQHADYAPTTARPYTTTHGGGGGGTSKPTSITTSKPTSITTSGTRTITTNSAPLNDDTGSNPGAIAAGVLIPIILIIFICVVLFFIWKRRGYLFRKESSIGRSVPNSYTDNSVDNEVYAEIGFVPDEPVMSPSYDTVYEPERLKPTAPAIGTVMSPSYDTVYEPGRLKTTAPEIDNGSAPAYVNSSNIKGTETASSEQKETKSKHMKFPFNKLISPADRLISYFKNQGEKDFPSTKQEKKSSSDNSDESYDHLRPASVISGVHIELMPPSDDPKHTYSHTADTLGGGKPVPNEPNQYGNINAKDENDEINAVHVGDAYIEFQCGPIDKDHPDLVKNLHHENDPNSRPTPPSRPPPSPGNGKRKDGLSPGDFSNRSNSPNLLFPAPVGSRSISPVSSEVSSNHSYKILDPMAVYDYADVSDDELGEAPSPPDQLYEDVDLKKKSIKKHVSTSVIPDDDSEYLEPVRSVSSSLPEPAHTQTTSPSKQGAPKSQFSLLKRELKNKLDNNQTNKPVSSVGANVNKGANKKREKIVANTDHPKRGSPEEKDMPAVGVKGVANMKKMFESDSDSSPKSSPRNIQTYKQQTPKRCEKNYRQDFI